MIKGSCHCGNVSFTFPATVQKIADCTCKDCQKSTGSLVSQVASVHPSKVDFNNCCPKKYLPKTGVQCDLHGGWLYCGDCGSRIAWFSNNGDLLDILRGTLENPDDIVVENMPDN